MCREIGECGEGRNVNCQKFCEVTKDNCISLTYVITDVQQQDVALCYLVFPIMSSSVADLQKICDGCTRVYFGLNIYRKATKLHL